MKLFGHFTFINSPRCTTLHLPLLQNTTERGACSFCKNLKTSTSFVKTFQVRSQVYLISPFTIAQAFAYFLKVCLDLNFLNWKSLFRCQLMKLTGYFIISRTFQRKKRWKSYTVLKKYAPKSIFLGFKVP